MSNRYEVTLEASSHGHCNPCSENKERREKDVVAFSRSGVSSIVKPRKKKKKPFAASMNSARSAVSRNTSTFGLNREYRTKFKKAQHPTTSQRNSRRSS